MEQTIDMAGAIEWHPVTEAPVGRIILIFRRQNGAVLSFWFNDEEHKKREMNCVFAPITHFAYLNKP